MKRFISLMLVSLLVLGLFSGCRKEPASLSSAGKGSVPAPVSDKGGSSETGHVDSPADTEATLATEPRDVWQVRSITPADAFDGGSGTEADPYQIADAAQLALFAKMAGQSGYSDAYYLITQDIPLNGIENYGNWPTSSPEFGWTPIPDFYGTLDGGSHRIRGMYINADASEPGGYGLFAQLHGRVSDLTVEHAYLCVSGADVSCGVICGTLYGGIVGCFGHSIMDCYTGAYGGLAGETKPGSVISDSEFSGSLRSCILGANLYLGGIAGSCQGTVQNCDTDGSVIDGKSSGGIVGELDGGTVFNCDARMDITGGFSGGIAGISKGTIGCSSNAGIVTGTQAGGIAGSMNCSEAEFPFSILSCSNEGYVISDRLGGGILGSLLISQCALFTMDDCTNTGPVSCQGSAGGILGQVYIDAQKMHGPVSFLSCENQGEVSSFGGDSGGIIGVFHLQGGEEQFRLSMDDCCNDGEITAGHLAGGLIGSIDAYEAFRFPVIFSWYKGAERGLGSLNYPDIGMPD